MNYVMLVSYAIIVYEAICCTILFNAFIPKKGRFHAKAWWGLAEIAFMSISSICITNAFEDILTRSLLICLFYFIDISLFRRCTMIVGFCVPIVFITVNLALDYFILIAFVARHSTTIENVTNTPQLFFIAAMISKTILFIAVFVISRLASQKEQLSYVKRSSWFLTIAQAVISAVALYALVDLCADLHTISPLTILSAALLLYSDVIVFWTLELAAKQGKAQNDQRIYRQQIDMQKANTESLARLNNVQKHIAHEYQNQIGTIHPLLLQGETTRALELVTSISNTLSSTLYRIRTNHEMVDAILNQKEQQATALGIRFSVRVIDLSSLYVSDEALIAVMCNAIDNAIEACEKVSCEKTIRIKFILEEGRMIFSVTNPVNGNVIKRTDNTILTSKQEASMHGIGLKNIAIALEQCNGDYDLFCDGYIFQFTAFFRFGQS